jgi:chromosome segregation ATPase
MSDQKSIETGVDKLVDIINRKKRVSLDEAAKELGVSVPVVQEWADFLEEEGLCSVEDKLRQTFLVEKKLSKPEVEKKVKEYSSKKDAFVRKVETALSSLQKESEGLVAIKQEFEKLKDVIGGDIDQVREELSELKHYEELKKNIDKEILQQRLNYQGMLEGIHKKVAEERKKYEGFIEAIGNEKNKIEEARVELSYLEKKEDNLKKRIEALKEILKSIDSEIDGQRAIIRNSLDLVASKLKDSEHLQKDMRYRLELEMEPLLRKVNENEEKILAVQNSVLQRVMAKNKEIDKYKLESTEAAEKFKTFFDRRSKTEELIASLEKEKSDLEKELNELIVKAKNFELMTKSADVKKYVKELMDGFKAMDKKRGTFTNKLGELTEFINKKQ